MEPKFFDDISGSSLAAIAAFVLVASVFYHFGFFLCIDLNFIALADYADYLKNSALFLPLFVAAAMAGALAGFSQDQQSSTKQKVFIFGIRSQHMFPVTGFLFVTLPLSMPLAWYPIVLLTAVLLVRNMEDMFSAPIRAGAKLPPFAFLASGALVLIFAFGYCQGARGIVDRFSL